MRLATAAPLVVASSNCTITNSVSAGAAATSRSASSGAMVALAAWRATLLGSLQLAPTTAAAINSVHVPGLRMETPSCRGPSVKQPGETVHGCGERHQDREHAELGLGVALPRHDDLVSRLEAHLVERLALGDGPSQPLPLPDHRTVALDPQPLHPRVPRRPARAHQGVAE